MHEGFCEGSVDVEYIKPKNADFQNWIIQCLLHIAADTLFLNCNKIGFAWGVREIENRDMAPLIKLSLGAFQSLLQALWCVLATELHVSLVFFRISHAEVCFKT